MGSEALICLALPGVPFFLACVFFFFLACASPPARPRARRRNQKKEALGKATSAWGVGKLGAWESGERGVASSCASLCCVLGLRVRLPLGLRFAPRAPDTAIKKGSPRGGYFCVSGWGEVSGGSLGEGALLLLALPRAVVLGPRVLLLLGLRFAPRSKKAFRCCFRVSFGCAPRGDHLPSFLARSAKGASSAQANRGADRQPPSWRCCCSWLLWGFFRRRSLTLSCSARAWGTTAV